MRLSPRSIVLTALLCTACGSHSASTHQDAQSFVENESLLSPSQKAFESFELRGGSSVLDFKMPSGGGRFEKSKHYFEVTTSRISQSLQAGPQIEDFIRTSLDPNLGTTPLRGSKFLKDGKILLQSKTLRRKIYFSGDQVQADFFADDHQTVIESNLYHFERFELSGNMIHSPEDILLTDPIDQWTRVNNFTVNAKWAPGSAYLKRRVTNAIDQISVEDCEVSDEQSDPQQAVISPCLKQASLEKLFPVVLGGDSHPYEHNFLEDGTISEVQGVRMWISKNPYAGYNPDYFRVYFEMNGNVYQGTLMKAGAHGYYPRTDEETVDYSIYLNDSAVLSFQHGLVTGAELSDVPFSDLSSGTGVDLFGIGGHGVNGSLSASDLRTHYQVPAELTGAGQVIAVIDAPGSGDPLADLNRYSLANRLPLCMPSNPCFEHIDLSTGYDENAKNEDWGSEGALDLQMAHAIAPKAKLVLVTAASSSGDDLSAAIQFAGEIPNLVAISMSFSGTIYSLAQEDAFAKLQQKGLALFASTGDGGHSDEPNYPAASVYVTAVGGTRIISVNTTADNLQESAWEYGGGGHSSKIPMPSWQEKFLGLLPEANPSPSPAPTVTPLTTSSPADLEPWASLFANMNPFIETSGPKRRIPDVSAVADGNHSALETVFNNRWFLSGGTSAASPIWAGFAALIAEKMKAEQKSLPALIANTPGGFNAILYQIKSAGANATSFYDVVSGSNNIASVSCPSCNATAGYDETTGIGSPNITSLLLNF